MNDILLVQNTSENNFSNLLNEIIDNFDTFSNNSIIENIQEKRKGKDIRKTNLDNLER